MISVCLDDDPEHSNKNVQSRVLGIFPRFDKHTFGAIASVLCHVHADIMFLLLYYSKQGRSVTTRNDFYVCSCITSVAKKSIKVTFWFANFLPKMVLSFFIKQRHIRRKRKSVKLSLTNESVFIHGLFRIFRCQLNWIYYRHNNENGNKPQKLLLNRFPQEISKEIFSTFCLYN